ncbi:MAG: SDR family NAD(P)-dependent oxidoreductase [bacterium]
MKDYTKKHNENKQIQNDKNLETYAFVTGASRGLGRAFTFELAKRNINLLLVALPEDGLPELCTHLKENYSIECSYFETDLTKTGNIKKLIDWTLSKFRINILINNAGIGGSKEFVEAETDYLEKMIALNVTALTLITHQLLPELKSHEQSYILNVGSIASFSPIGYKTIYPASKVFTHYFTRGLHQELKGTGVNVSVLHPGPMRTNRQVIKRINKHGLFGSLGVLNTEYVAEKSLDNLFHNKPQITLGWFNKFIRLLMKTVPISIRLPIMTKRIKRELKAKKQS